MIPEQINWLFQHSTEPRVWLTQVFVVVFLTVSVNFILMRLIDIADRFTRGTKNLWDHALLEAARIPVRLVFWVIGLSIAVGILDGVAETELFHYAPEARSVAYIVILAMFLTRFISQAEKVLRDPSLMEKPVDETTASALGKLLRLSVMITAGLIILQSMGYSISGVLALGGIGGVAVGFASRDLLANFFGALVVYWDKPFKVGDWVRSPDRDIEGTVEEIGWRVTRIRTFDQRPLYVPNATFTSIAVENPSRMYNRRMFERMGIRYSDGDKMAAICADVRAMLEQHPDIEPKRTLMVNFDTYGASHLEFFVYAFTKTINWVEFHRVKEEVLLKVMEIVEGHGAEFAFPTRTLHMIQPEPEPEPQAETGPEPTP